MQEKQVTLKIVFICASLEPGADGVGDYTRRLAAALIKAGHQCKLLALNDHKVIAITETVQHADGIAMSVLRLPASSPEEHRVKAANEWVSAFDPQWLSLQYVPFGYHPKGLKFGLSKLLLPLGQGRKWHVMMHEMWVGMAREESAKLHLWGWLQRRVILSLLGKLKPAVIHTQTQLYQLLLKQAGYQAAFLPLFGNIPVLREVPRDSISPKKKLQFVVFGSIHDRAPIDQFAQEASAYAKKTGKDLTLTIIGRGNTEQQRWANDWAAEGLSVNILGELPVSEISDVLSAADIGLSATALAVIGKSGTVAAMQEHGLPVICVAKPWTPLGVTDVEVPQGIFAYEPGNFEAIIKRNDLTAHGVTVDAVSVTFARDLQNKATTS